MTKFISSICNKRLSSAKLHLIRPHDYHDNSRILVESITDKIPRGPNYFLASVDAASSSKLSVLGRRSLCVEASLTKDGNDDEVKMVRKCFNDSSTVSHEDFFLSMKDSRLIFVGRASLSMSAEIVERASGFSTSASAASDP